MTTLSIPKSIDDWVGKFDDFAIVSFDFLRVFSGFFLVRVAAERKSFLMDVHSDVNCAIIHSSDLRLYAVIPVLVVANTHIIQVNPLPYKLEVITYCLDLASKIVCHGADRAPLDSPGFRRLCGQMYYICAGSGNAKSSIFHPQTWM